MFDEIIKGDIEIKKTILLEDGILDLFYRAINNRKYEITGIIAGCNEPKIGLKWLDLIQDPTVKFDRVYGAVKHLFVVTLASDQSNKNMSEFVLHDLFKEHISEVIPGAKIAKVKKSRKHIPDAFICFDKGKAIPVEIKRDDFDQKALNQLNRYCKAYKSTRGVAVGEKCTVKLPNRFIFVENEDLLCFREEEEEVEYGDSPLECLEKIKRELTMGVMIDKMEYGTEFIHTITGAKFNQITPIFLAERFLTLFEKIVEEIEGK